MEGRKRVQRFQLEYIIEENFIGTNKKQTSNKEFLTKTYNNETPHLNGLNWSRAYNNEIHNKGYRAGSYAEITVSVLSYLYSPFRE